MRRSRSQAKPAVVKRRPKPAVTAPDRQAADDLFAFVIQPLVAEADVTTARMFGSTCHGRTSKEWVAVPPGTDEAWRTLAREARTFVGAIR